MKNKKLENTLENIKLLGRASVLFPYTIGTILFSVAKEEVKGAYYRTFKIPHIAYSGEEGDEFTSYIRLEN